MLLLLFPYSILLEDVAADDDDDDDDDGCAVCPWFVGVMSMYMLFPSLLQFSSISSSLLSSILSMLLEVLLHVVIDLFLGTLSIDCMGIVLVYMVVCGDWNCDVYGTDEGVIVGE